MASTTHSGPDTTLYLYTSLTAGSSHIITATSRLETILKANKVAFRALDCATDEKARMLWSRRSKGRKLPGLVKFGQVIGDLKEVEEWNEYGELNENIDGVSDIFGDTPMTDHPMAPPAPITLKDPLAKTSQPPSRSSSETRHISISDPKDSSPASSVKNLRDENPMSMAMRQAGAEAAAKAGQRKASAASSLKSSSTASAVPLKRDSTETTPTAAATKMSADAEEPAKATAITDAKTPAQLAAQGVTKTSTDKITETPAGASQGLLAPESEKVSNEEQMLELRRSSSVTKTPSKLAQETSIEDMPSSSPETAVASGTNLPGTAPSVSEAQPRQHRGSSISEASKEEIKEIEERNAIKEEPEESEESDDSTSDETQPTIKTAVQATDKAEAEVLKGDRTQDQKAKDASAASVSAAAALFLSPNHDLNPNRLSADSASVYSFFDSAFSPAPLFSGAKNLDLNLSFARDLGQSDPRASTSTYGTNNAYGEEIDRQTDKSEHDETPRQSHETQRTQLKQEQDEDQEPSYRESLAIAPLRTPARRQVSEPLLDSSLNRVSTPPSAPLPLNIRKSPTPTMSTMSSPSHSRTHTAIQTQLPSEPQPLARSHTVSSFSASPFLASTPVSAVSGLASPASPSASSPTTPASAVSESRSLRFKKSIRSLRSKKSAQLLNASSPSPTRELPPNLPPQRQLKDLRSVSDMYTTANSPTEKRRGPEKSSVKNLLCF